MFICFWLGQKENVATIWFFFVLYQEGIEVKMERIFIESQNRATFLTLCWDQSSESFKNLLLNPIFNDNKPYSVVLGSIRQS